MTPEPPAWLRAFLVVALATIVLSIAGAPPWGTMGFSIVLALLEIRRKP